MMVEIMGFAENAPNGTSTGYALFTVDEMTEEISSDIAETNIGEAIKIYPNPFSENTMLTFENPKGEECILTIYDSKGKVVKTIDQIDNGQFKIERNNLPDGIYYFDVHSESAFFGNGKFVLQKAD
jgi:flagellar hook assembly protein FlgD